ncbi:MAG: hypothetical protein JJU36_13110 [Phycisphaeraceae bacterium]|nr:hypothetical protein [Phycisphaeraceae bacterium]
MFLSGRVSIVAVLLVVLGMGVARVDAVLVSFNDPSFFGTDQVFVNFSGLAGSSGQVFRMTT